MSPDIVSIPLFLSSFNDAGLVFSNPDLKVVVIRWLGQEDLDEGHELVDLALDEMAGIQSNAVIYDMRKLPQQVGSDTDVVLASKCIRSTAVERFAILGGPGMPKTSQPNKAALSLASERGLRLLLSDDFAEAASWIDTLQNDPSGPWLTRGLPPNFWGSYGGCTYSIPEYSCTVFKTAGNVGDLDLVRKALQKWYELHAATGATTGLLDSTASPPISEGERYLFTYKEVVLPMTAGGYKQLIHVRSGDDIVVAGKAPPLGPLLESLEIPYFETASVEEALEVLHVLQGKAPKPAEKLKKSWLARTGARFLALALAGGTLIETLEFAILA